MPKSISFAVIFTALFTLAVPAFGQSGQTTSEDGMGRVQYDDGASDNGPAEEPAPREVVTPRSEPVRATPVRSRNGQPVVGRKAAEKYMAPKDKEAAKKEQRSYEQPLAEDHIMTVSIGSFVSDHAWKWGGNDRVDNAANINFGLSYRFAEWTHVADIYGAAEYTTYSLRGKSVQKLSILPKISFPDVASHFPLYFGVGAGLGIFTKQLHDESALAIDYTFFAGLRFLNIFPNTGFFAETGMKNDFNLLSDGQFNGWFISLGAIFAF